MAEDRPDPLATLDWKAFTPKDSPKGLPEVMAEMKDLASAELAVGERATDFSLPLNDFSSGTGVARDERFHLLAEARERPVALIFGSYT